MASWSQDLKSVYPLPEERITTNGAWGTFKMHGKVFFGRIQGTSHDSLYHDKDERLVITSKTELDEIIELLNTLRDMLDE